MITQSRGSTESAGWFRKKLHDLDMSQSALARLMIERGDDRQMTTILRSLSRMASGEARVSGEMRALLGTLALTVGQTVDGTGVGSDGPDRDGGRHIERKKSRHPKG